MKTYRLDFGSNWIEVKCAPWAVNAGGTVESNLKIGNDSYYDAAIDGVESLLLSLACAGVDLSTPPVKAAVQTTLDAIGNHYDTSGIYGDCRLCGDDLYESGYCMDPDCFYAEHTQNMPPPAKDYNHFDAAVEDLSHTYDELNDGNLVKQIRGKVSLLDTGNHAEDYKNVRNQVENWIMDRRI